MENIAEMGFKKPTPVQMQVIPALLEDRNVLVTAPTGTGKTLAYLLPIIQNLLRKRMEQHK
jgi:ATP-dependent RNA helicase DDX52/ROK1